MKLTEKEASEKWCPHWSFALSCADDFYDSRPTAGTEGRCIGSRCMAWQWVESIDEIEREHNEAIENIKSRYPLIVPLDRNAPLEHALIFAEQNIEKQKADIEKLKASGEIPKVKDRHGYCGLSGKVE